MYDKNTSRPYCHVKDFARLIDKVLRAKKKKSISKFLIVVVIKTIFRKKNYSKLKKIFNFPEIVY